MGLQKYRADVAGDQQSNGATPYYAMWGGGRTLSLVHKCPIRNTVVNDGVSPRTVYIRGEADTFFSIPAACAYTMPRTMTSPPKRVILRGYLTTDDVGEYEFRCHKNQGV